MAMMSVVYWQPTNRLAATWLRAAFIAWTG